MFDELESKILESYKQGNICFATVDGVRTCKMEDFVTQPLEGMLYDINRDKATILHHLGDPKWINDLALTHLLQYYYDRCNKMEEELHKKGCNGIGSRHD